MRVGGASRGVLRVGPALWEMAGVAGWGGESITVCKREREEKKKGRG